ncbi:MAG TPA: HD domain-containing phosphohydrolase [Candidatus Limnocylindrales bacterium]|nr:HD domain-containing phosphohydrolase [Candidatus Limnocylindrales bacterium]
MTVPVGPDGALAVYSAVGDAFAGRRIGFGRRRAALAANFARNRGRDDEAVAASWVAGLLAEIGLLAGPKADKPEGEGALEEAGPLATADVALHAAHLVAAIPGLPRGAADIVRWHREHDDGTGVPDGLRWDGIPADAAALGIAHAFVAAVEDPEEPRDATEALFGIAAECGRAFRIELVRAFREFIASAPDRWDAAPEVALPAPDRHELGTALSTITNDTIMGGPTPNSSTTITIPWTPRLDGVTSRVATELGLDRDGAADVKSLIILARVFFIVTGAPA